MESYYLIYVKILRPTRSISQVVFYASFLSVASFWFVNLCRICPTAKRFFHSVLLIGILATALVILWTESLRKQKETLRNENEFQGRYSLLIDNIISSIPVQDNITSYIYMRQKLIKCTKVYIKFKS